MNDKPVIKCNKLKFKKVAEGFFSVVYSTKNNTFNNGYACNNLKEEDGKIITDDFIFVKEE